MSGLDWFIQGDSQHITASTHQQIALYEPVSEV